MGHPVPWLFWVLPSQLRAAGEYEERKLIRAAIRKLRAEEIEGEAPFLCSWGGSPGRCEMWAPLHLPLP
uniref:Smoothelin domain-containing protein n=1 Tax=Junco hyemalis TaxID=40217 RepID=A0A8C5JSP4_JUNHY